MEHMNPLRRNSGPGGPDPSGPGAGSGPSLGASLERAAFYPELVADTLDEVLDGREVIAHLVHVDTHFDFEEIHRHITVLALAEDVMAAAHLDDHALDDAGKQIMAQVSTELVHLRRLDSVVMTTLHARPEQYRRSDKATEVTLAITWAGGQRLDLAPAACGDPQCEADHGYTGTATREDLVLRVAAEAEGQPAVDAALHFAQTLRRKQVEWAGR